MREAFMLTLSNREIEDYKRQAHRFAFEETSNEVRDAIQNYSQGDSEVLDGTKISRDWFPEIRRDVFISHSHQDEAIAKGLAAWMKTNLGLTSFIDSMIWGHSDDLTLSLDNEYSKIEEGLYSYQSCRVSSGNIHMMLAVALTRILSQSEIVIFINSPNSLNVPEAVKNEGANNTLSPWIFFELSMTTMLDRSLRHEVRKKSASLEAATVAFDAPIDHLVPLSHANLESLTNSSRSTSAEYLSQLLKMGERWRNAQVALND